MRYAAPLRALILMVLGGLAAMGQAPQGFWWVTLVVLAAFLLLANPAPGPRRAFGHAFWFAAGYFAIALRWIVSPLLVEPEVYGWMAPFAVVLMSGGMALFWAAGAGLAHHLRPASGLMLALMLTLAEVARSLILTGFPWALVGHIWIDTPLAQLAQFSGPHGLTLLTLLMAWSLAALVLRQWSAGVIPAGAAALAWGIAPGSPPEMSADAPIVRLVQPNAPQVEKWDIDKRFVFYERMLGFTAESPAPDLIVWPETALPSLLEYSFESFGAMAQASGGNPVIAGLNSRDGNRYYNSLVVLGADGIPTAQYDKAHIVPFGEYTPGGELLARLGLAGVAASQGAAFSAGPGDHLIDLPGIGAARALICYEGIFAEEITIPDQRPRLIVLITNDAWFGNGAGPAQHLAQARLRAIEQGLPMVRVANTGISAMIDAQGRVTRQLPLNTAGFLDAALPPAATPPPYVRYGDGPILIVLLAFIAGLALFRRGA